MSTKKFHFLFNGSIKDFSNNLNQWLNNTIEGKRYKIKDSSNSSFVKIQRGIGLLTSAIIIEFSILQDFGDSVEFSALGYINAYFGLIKSPISKYPGVDWLARSNGWKDMMKILDYLEVSFYTSS